MNIAKIQSGSTPISTKKVGSATDSPKSERSSSASKTSEAEAPKSGDRVELSTAARARSTEQDGELARARESLRALPPLEAERREVILERVKKGYYSQPENLKIIAERLSADLTGRESEL